MVLEDRLRIMIEENKESVDRCYRMWMDSHQGVHSRHATLFYKYSAVLEALETLLDDEVWEGTA